MKTTTNTENEIWTLAADAAKAAKKAEKQGLVTAAARIRMAAANEIHRMRGGW